jgi:hypothetical protein
MLIVPKMRVALVAMLAGAGVCSGQGAIRGTIVRSGTAEPIVGAEIVVLPGSYSATSDSMGRYTFEGLAGGQYLLQIRRVGFAARRDTVAVEDGRTVVRRHTLMSVASLDTMRVAAPQAPSRAPLLRAFDERRLAHQSGYFISEAELRKSDGEALANVIAQHAPGLRVMQTNIGGSAIISTRKSCAGPVFEGHRKNGCIPCFATVYIDGHLVYTTLGLTRYPDPSAPPPFDFDHVQVEDFAGVEFYAGTGTAPPEFNATSDGCGLLLLWSREH